MRRAQGWFHFSHRLDRRNQKGLGTRSGQHAGTGPVDLRDSETIAPRPVDRALEVGRNAIRIANRLPFQGHRRRAGLGKRARVCTFAGGLPHPLSPGPTGPEDAGTAHQGESHSPDVDGGGAKQLVAQFRGDTIKTRSIRAVLRERLRRLAEYFAANLADLSAEDMDLAEAQLTRVIQQIGAAKADILDASGNSSTFTTQL